MSNLLENLSPQQLSQREADLIAFTRTVGTFILDGSEEYKKEEKVTLDLSATERNMIRLYRETSAFHPYVDKYGYASWMAGHLAGYTKAIYEIVNATAGQQAPIDHPDA